MKTINQLLKEHPFFYGVEESDLNLIAACGSNVIFKPQDYIAKENDQADTFYLIRQGHVGIEVFIPHKAPMLLQTLHGGDILGWSWLFPPYKWSFDVRAIEEVHAIALNGKCLREKCDKDTRLGYDLMKRFAHIMTNRLQDTRRRLVDVYGGIE